MRMCGYWGLLEAGVGGIIHTERALMQALGLQIFPFPIYPMVFSNYHESLADKEPLHG